MDASLIYARLALELEPDFSLAQLLAGEIRDDQGRTADALALYNAVGPQSPLYWSARLRAALALDQLDKTDEAEAMLKTLATQRPNSIEPLVELGDVYRGHEKYEDAATAYDQAIARQKSGDANSWRLYYDRGVSLERSGRWPLAEADLKHALELAPQEPLVLNYLGYSWIDKGENLSDALKMIERAVELRPNDGYIVDSLGWAYYRLGDLAKATQYLERAIELMPEDPTINDHLGDVYWKVGRKLEARFQWTHARDLKPDPDELEKIEQKLKVGLAEDVPASAAEADKPKKPGDGG
jgi:Flp pilus assembly protein TadD